MRIKRMPAQFEQTLIEPTRSTPMQIGSTRRKILDGVIAAGEHYCWSYLLAAGLVMAGTMVSGHAVAGCGSVDPSSVVTPPAGWSVSSSASGLMPAVYHPGSNGFMRVSDYDSSRHYGADATPANAGIVGTWRFTFISDGKGPVPVNGIVDFGTTQWHSDGTEFMISGSRPPSTGDVCMGAWEQIGDRTFKLKHIALAWVSGDTKTMPPSPPPATDYVGPTIIRQEVVLNHAHTRFEGTFTLDAYDKTEVNLLVHISGKVIGTRFTVD